MNYWKKIIILVIAIIGCVYFLYAFKITDYLSLTYIRAYDSYIQQFLMDYYILVVALYILCYGYILVIPLPLSFPVTMIGGYLFSLSAAIVYSLLGVGFGTFFTYIFFRSGAMIINQKICNKFTTIIETVRAHGASYMLMLHACMVPFFIINFIAVLARIPIKTMVWVSTIGSFPYIWIAAVAGSQMRNMQADKPHIAWSYIILAMILLVVAAIIAHLIKKYKHISIPK